MQKGDLRKLYLQKRKGISANKASKFHEGIYTNFEHFLRKDIKVVHIYLPIANKAEIDTWPIIQYLWSKNTKVIVPKMEPNSMLSSWILTPDTKMSVNKWKVPEPVDAEPAANNTIDMVILPLLVCDKLGNRIGYGMGYYDRFLASVKQKLMKVGLSYFSPIDIISNPDPWDIPLDYCISPDEVIKF